MELKGFWCPSEIESILSEIDCKFERLSNHLPCIGILVHGFNNCVTSWIGKGNEHGKYLSGENSYGILMSSGEVTCVPTVREDEESSLIEKTVKGLPTTTTTTTATAATTRDILKKGLVWRISDSYDFALEKL